MTEQGKPEPDDPRAVRLRRLAWSVVTLVGLWFVADGLTGLWSDAGVVARALIVGAAVLVAAFVVLGVAYVLRRDRQA